MGGIGRPPKVDLTDRAMDAQVAIAKARHECAPAWEAALASGNWMAISEAKALDVTLRAATLQAKRLAGIADGLLFCADGILEPGHGRAA